MIKRVNWLSKVTEKGQKVKKAVSVSYKMLNWINILLGALSFKKSDVWLMFTLQKVRICKTAFEMERDGTSPPKSTQCIKMSQCLHICYTSSITHDPVNWEKGRCLWYHVIWQNNSLAIYHLHICTFIFLTICFYKN